MTVPFDPTPLLAPGLPPPAAPWNGFPDYNFVGGHNDADGVPVDGLLDAVTTALRRDGRELATYGLNSGPQGYRPLRGFVAAKLAGGRGIRCDADEVLITSGSLQGLDLVNEAFLVPGDVVLAERFSYGGALARLYRRGVDVIGVPLDGEGLRPDALAAALDDLRRQGRRAKFLYTIPTVQNPTGVVMGEPRRREIIALAAEHELLIFEDECYADLLWGADRPPALRALAGPGRVVHIGSFSKSIAPALRVGYLVADWPLLGQLLACKTDAGSGALEQMMLAEYCTAHFDDHVAALNRRLAAKARTLCDALGESFGTAAEFTAPVGGIFLWVTLPPGVDTLRLAAAAARAGIAINPGPEWSTDAEPAARSLRLCFAHPSERQLCQGVARLAEICAAEFGVPARIANVSRA